MKIKKIDFNCRAFNNEEEVFAITIKTYRYAIAENALWGQCVRKKIKFTNYIVEPVEPVTREYEE